MTETAYCGPPPTPAQLWFSWNLDPVLIAGLVAVASLYMLGGTRLDRGPDKLAGAEKAAFYSGWLLTALALISPLCALSVSLFAARVGQHIILTLLAAPLVVTGRPIEALAAALGRPAPRGRWMRPAPLSAAAVFTVLLWFWHAPAPYAATFANTFVYWAMHFSVFGSALWLWHGLVHGGGGSVLARLAGGFISSVQMGFLGALIALAPRLVYAPHALTTAVWGLTPLQDQQLGGVIMWVPGCLIFLAFALVALAAALREPQPADYRSV
ncbi:MAG: cytochrome c oxidase assembly protein [Alphaproteobacteria bacterium]|nr:cytochrome c oxidase assembly protein [Alphaproteobacteria bacterium]